MAIFDGITVGNATCGAKDLAILDRSEANSLGDAFTAWARCRRKARAYRVDRAAGPRTLCECATGGCPA